ncbi:uncharacterized protein [Blastocystis hominis]|uniref:Uncharacterized protein n=1 Tax=Blastocystis hominis TaxID=12968 RepID=D8LUY6_BLAHO|nr:uncharacterized protein [Blastocystis hominis]CBK19625.2 unnamed protein product [Blastocystis hominis]|eukprot:XP_012893673.1 uncharacterized protein [Blastocystis hominis]
MVKLALCVFLTNSEFLLAISQADKDIKRSNLYAKLSKSISCAVQQGGPDPTKNLKLEAAISAAKAASMPKENIERAINGKSVDASKLQFITYEGFGPGSCAIIVECLTDNKKRTVSEIRHIFTKGMGRLGTIGSASFLFKYMGTLTFPKDDNQDHIFDLALEAGADDVVENEDENTVVVQCAPTQLHAMKEAFAKEKLEGKMGLAYLPTVRFRAFGAYL